MDRGIWFDLVDLVPRYPTIDNELDERAADLDRSAPIRSIWRKILERSALPKSTGAVLERQITAAAAAAGAPIATAAGTGQLQGDYKTQTRLDNIPCYQWSKDRITRPRVPQISGQTAQFRGKSTGIRRPRTPCRPAGAWAMFLTNSCHKNDMGYNYVIAGLFRGPDP